MATLEIKVTLNAPLFIAGGDEVAGSLTPVVRDARGRPCIPATMFKGLHRATTEQVATALGLKTCNPPVASQMCHPHGGVLACVACRLFGSPWLSGKLFYHDLILTTAPVSVTPISTPQSRRRRVRLTSHRVNHEILPANQALTGRIEHLIQEPALLALALAGLRSIIAIGAHSATGFGLCSVEAKAYDNAKRPIDDAMLAAALRQLSQHRPKP